MAKHEKQPKEEIENVMYLNRAVPKEGFRVFIYHIDGSERLIESYDDFLALTSSEDWHATKEDAKAKIKVRKKTEL